jgi:hypothetical protein
MKNIYLIVRRPIDVLFQKNNKINLEFLLML